VPLSSSLAKKDIILRYKKILVVLLVPLAPSNYAYAWGNKMLPTEAEYEIHFRTGSKQLKNS